MKTIDDVIRQLKKTKRAILVDAQRYDDTLDGLGYSVKGGSLLENVSTLWYNLYTQTRADPHNGEIDIFAYTVANISARGRIIDAYKTLSATLGGTPKVEYIQ